MYLKLEKLLKKHGTIAYCASKSTGIATATLSDWKNGRSKPKIDKLQKIANYFGIPVTYFIDDDEPNFK